MSHSGLTPRAFTQASAKLVTPRSSSQKISKRASLAFSDSFKRIGESFGGVGGDLANQISAIKNAVSPLIGEMGSLSGAAGGFSVAAVAAGVAALGIAVKFSETAAHLDELSQSTGVSVENLSLLGDVAKTKGIGVDEMGKALQKMSRSAFEASAGSGKAVRAFLDLGISVTNTNGSMKPTIQLFNEVAAKFKDMPDGPRKTAEAMQIFGRGAASLIGVLNLSGDKLKDLEGHFSALNDVISGPTAAASADLKEQIELISGGFEGVENEITNQLVPALLVVTKEMVSAFEGQQDNIKFIIEAVAGISKGLLNCGQAAALLSETLGEVLTFGVGFKQLGKDIQSVAGAMINASHGDWKGAYEGMREAAVGSLNAIGDSNKRITDDIKNSIKGISDVWTASLPAASKPNNQEGAPAAQPISEYNAKDSYQMMQRYEKEIEESHKRKAAVLKDEEDMREEERRATASVIEAIKKTADEQRKASMEQIADIEKIKEAQIKNSGANASSGVKALAELNQISKKQEAQQLAAIDRQELDAYKQARAGFLETLKNNLAQMRTAEAAAKGTGGDAEATEKATDAQKKCDEAVAETTREVQKLQAAIKGDETETQKLASSWTSYFGKMKSETSDLGATVRSTIQNDMTKAISSFSNAIAKSIVEGKNFGKAMKEVARGIAEDMISSTVKFAVQWLASQAEMAIFGKVTATTNAAAQIAANKAIAMSSAGVAGANATASFAMAPWPIDMGAGAFGAETFAAALSFSAFEKGGLVGHTGMAQLHKNEMVLPQPIAEKVQKMADPDSGSRNGGRPLTVTQHNTVHTMDSKSVGEVLSQHSGQLAQIMVKELRRRNLT